MTFRSLTSYRALILLVALLTVTPSLQVFASQEGPRFLTGPKDGDALVIVLDYVENNRETLGLTASDLYGLHSEQYVSAGTGITHVRLVQRHAGIDVWQGEILANVASDGSIINLHNRFAPRLEERIASTQASLSPTQAVERAANHLGLTISEPLVVVSGSTEASQDTVVSDGGISRREIPTRLVWSVDKGANLAWDLNIYEVEREHWWSVRIDASSGVVINQEDWVVHDNFGDLGAGSSIGQELAPTRAPRKGGLLESYRVFEWPVESPLHNPTGTSGTPVEGRTDQLAPSTSASPFGWHDTDGVAGADYTITRGNNVHVVKGAFSPDCGPSLDCSSSPTFDLDLSLDPSLGSNVSAAIVNLFYWNNIVHDVWYNYGFDEASGNFQENNYGNGGFGSDWVVANAQAGGNCNANFSTPVDGSLPVMNMYPCDIATPSRDGDLDNGVIAHEYGHGISNRLTAGPNNVSCLFNNEQMGEGWSDWFGLAMTIEAGDLGTDVRSIGTYLLGQAANGPGVRTQPYSTDMSVNTLTYGDLGGMAIPHGVGEVWAAMIWDLTWALVDDGSQSGLDLDIYNGVGGNNLAMQLVMDGLKLQPCEPGFVDGRDAILLADQNLTGGANQCVIWAAFARRGLGFSASQGSSSSTSDGVEAFDMPPSCDFLNPTPVTQAVCADGPDADFNIDVNDSYTGPVTLSASGNPAGTTTSFSPNPVSGPLPMATTLTIGNITEAAVGQHTITVTGNDGVNNESSTVELVVYTNVLAAASLVAPTDGAVDVPISPTLTWAPVAGAAAYLVEVDDDPAFASIDESATVATNNHTVGVALGATTTYYWRVTPENTCAGPGPSSSVFSFTTVNMVCSAPALAIPDDDPIGISDTLTVVTSGAITDLDVVINATHTFVGDLIFTLSHDGGASAVVIDRPGVPAGTFGCAGNDVAVTMNDDGTEPVEDFCSDAPALFGSLIPENPLAAFNGEDLSGNWTLTVSDNAGFDTGAFDSWCLLPAVEGPRPADLFSDGFELGDTSAWSESQY